MTIPLTQRQEQLWRYIKSCERSPSYVEMRDHLGLESKSGIHRLIEALEERGYISRIKNRARSIVAIEPRPELRLDRDGYMIGGTREVVYLPLHGRIS